MFVTQLLITLLNALRLKGKDLNSTYKCTEKLKCLAYNLQDTVKISISSVEFYEPGL